MLPEISQRSKLIKDPLERRLFSTVSPMNKPWGLGLGWKAVVPSINHEKPSAIHLSEGN